MKVITPIVSIEISRRCNLDCAHCMRGEADSSTIDIQLLNKFFDEVKSANMLVISGGEPFMCYEEIKILLEIIREKNVFVPKVLIVTNGTIYDERIYKLLESSFECIEINISIDDYHIESIKRRYSTDKTSDNPKLRPINIDEVIENCQLHKNSPYFGSIYRTKKYLIDTGRATDLDVPKKSFEAIGYFYSDCILDDGYILAGPQIYLDTQGYITDGNSEYASRSQISIGNIKDNSLSEILISNAIKVECSTPLEFIELMHQREMEYQQYKGKSYIYQDNRMLEIESDKTNVKKRTI